jgi:RNA polymerase sigma-70 factor (ECF subfamily)
VTLCDKDFKQVADFKFPFSKFGHGPRSKWVELSCKPTLVPREFVICLNFNPTRTKGVLVSYDAEGPALVGLPGKPAGQVLTGDWMLRALVDRRKP